MLTTLLLASVLCIAPPLVGCGGGGIAVQNNIFDLQPSGNYVVQIGSNVTFTCHNRLTNNDDKLSSSAKPVVVGLLFNSSQTSQLLLRFLKPTRQNGGHFSVSLNNLSRFEHSGWYQCAVRNPSANNKFQVLSPSTLLIVGSPPQAASTVEFYWRDRSNFESLIRPSLISIANSTGVPYELGGQVSAELLFSRGTRNFEIAKSNCRCDCNANGYCKWGRLSQGFSSDDHAMTVQLRLCNRLGWCSDRQVFEFDLRDMEQPNPVRKLTLQFQPHQLNISWQPPTTELLSNLQEYSYQVLLSDGRILATNDTDVSVPVAPDTSYWATVRCRPRHFVGHWSDNSSRTGRSGEWLPCNPELGGAFLVPPSTLVFPASNRNCSNGKIISYRVTEQFTNSSQLVKQPFNVTQPDLVNVDLSNLLRWHSGFEINKDRPFQLAIFAATSAGENSSLPTESLVIGPIDGACSGDEAVSNITVTCLDNPIVLNLIDCKLISYVDYGDIQRESLSKANQIFWYINRGVACQLVARKLPVFQISMVTVVVLLILFAVIFIVYFAIRNAKLSVPSAFTKDYPVEPDSIPQQYLSAHSTDIAASSNPTQSTSNDAGSSVAAAAQSTARHSQNDLQQSVVVYYPLIAGLDTLVTVRDGYCSR